MATEFISADLAASYTVDPSDTVFLLHDVTITANDDGFTQVASGDISDLTLTLQGSVYARDGIDFYWGLDTVSDAWIYLGEDARLHTSRDGIILQEGTNNAIFNHGEITAAEEAIYSHGGEIRLENHGSITSFGAQTFGAVVFTSNAAGTDIRQLLNTGTISSGDLSGLGVSQAVVTNRGGAQFQLENSGRILAANGDKAIYSSVAFSDLTNSGHIKGDIDLDGQAVIFNSGTINGAISLSASSEVFNFGTIEGQVSMAGGGNDFLNDGIVIGDVYLGNGGGFYRGMEGSYVTGQISGSDQTDLFVGGSEQDNIRAAGGNDVVTAGGGADIVEAGAGSDTVLGEAGGDLILGGLGADVLHGNADDDRLEGEDGADLLRGGSGEDTLFGGKGSDTLKGGAGDDTLEGGKGDDLLRGGAQDDLILGQNGEDTLRGGEGDDTLIGGADQDLLIGRGGNDVFRFNSASDSANTASARDEIADFAAGDVIDLAGVVAGAFDFVGTGTFTGSANEVRINETGAGNSVIYVDTDADGSAEMRILVTDTLGLTAGDFIL